jgi:RimJ/RimL family protein N-acetyltransferase
MLFAYFVITAGVLVAIIQTERLTFCWLTIADAPMMLALLNEPSFIANIGDRNVRTIAHAEQYLIDGPLASYQSHGYGMYRVERTLDGTTLGLCGLVRRDYLPSPDLGYAFFPEFAGQGYATEAARAVYLYGKTTLKIPQIVGIVQSNNLASTRVLQKVGLHKHGIVEVPTTKEELDFYVENN